MDASWVLVKSGNLEIVLMEDDVLYTFEVKMCWETVLQLKKNGGGTGVISYKLQRTKRMNVKEMIDNKISGIKLQLGPLGVKTRLFIPKIWSLSESRVLPPGIQ